MQQRTIDASVVLARILREPRPDWVDETLAEAKSGRVHLIAPSLIWLEIGNRLARGREISGERALEAMMRVEAIGLEVVEIGRPLRLRALTLAREHRLSMHDATYLAVAEATGTPLLTLDARLEQAAESMGLGRGGGGRRISEPPATYGDRPVDTTSLAAIGQALAEMRREYSA